MDIPGADINGKPFSERDKKLLRYLLPLNGSSLFAINSGVMKKVPARSYTNDSKRLAARVGGRAWSEGSGDTRRFGITLPTAQTKVA
jgi:hypothetical protein